MDWCLSSRDWQPVGAVTRREQAAVFPQPQLPTSSNTVELVRPHPRRRCRRCWLERCDTDLLQSALCPQGGLRAMLWWILCSQTHVGWVACTSSPPDSLVGGIALALMLPDAIVGDAVASPSSPGLLVGGVAADSTFPGTHDGCVAAGAAVDSNIPDKQTQ